MSSEHRNVILLVDNDPAVLLALSTRLAASGYTCLTALSGAQGLAAFSAAEIDLVISDLSMPNGDGVTLSQSIRRISPVPIILMSGFKPEFQRRLRQVPDVAFLHKPFATQDLVDLVDAHLAASHPQPM